VSLNNENICREISEDKKAVCEKTAGLRSGNFSDLNSAVSACSKVSVAVKIFQIQDMLNENRFLGTFPGHNTWTNSLNVSVAQSQEHAPFTSVVGLIPVSVDVMISMLKEYSGYSSFLSQGMLTGLVGISP
jgi:hypothetical protein